MKRSLVVSVFCLLCAGALNVHAQVAPSATRPQFTLNVGALGSLFQPDYAGNGISQTASNRLLGPGAFVDVRLRRWLQLEAEGRWLRFNEFADIREDNYLIGYRVPIRDRDYHGFTPYGKALVGYGKMNFQYNFAYGRFADIALGGGVDYRLTRKISVRAFDFEYQMWPNWINGTLKPYGGSVGLAYKVF